MAYQRRKGRELALKILFQNEFQDIFETKSKNQILNNLPKPDHYSLEEKDFAWSLLFDIKNHIPDIDKLIEARSKNWKFDRISLVDLNIMRLCIFEMMYKEDIPDKTSLNEAIEIAKIYGEKNSPTFINGILDSILNNELNKKELNKKE